MAIQHYIPTISENQRRQCMISHSISNAFITKYNILDDGSDNFALSHWYPWHESLPVSLRNKSLSTPFFLPQNWCKTMDWLEKELNVTTVICLYCKSYYGHSIEGHFFCRYKVCDSCLPKLLVEYNKGKSEITFDQFIDYKRVMDVLTLYS